MSSNGKDTTAVPTTTCPECKREWPTISEQAVVQDQVGVCYACWIHQIVAERDQRMADADYEIENCPTCTGIPGAREKCTTCFGKGWRKQEGEGVIQLLQ
jgi:hypothetical protein